MSKLFHLQLNDVEKAILMATFSPVAGYVASVLQSFASGQPFSFSFNMALKYAFIGFSGYLAKNFLTNSNQTFLQGEPNLGGATQVSGAFSYLKSHPWIVGVVVALVLFAIDPMLVGFVIVGVLLYFAFHYFGNTPLPPLTQ